MFANRKIFTYLLFILTFFIISISSGGIVRAENSSSISSSINSSSSSSEDEEDVVEYENYTANSIIHLDDVGAISTINQIASTYNTKYGYDLLGYDANKKIIIFNKEIYYSMLIDERKSYITDVLRAIKDTNLKPKYKNKLYNFISRQDGDAAKLLRNFEKDINADLYSGSKWYEPFNGPINTLLGVIALAIYILLSFTFLIDIAYLVIPFFGSWFDSDSEGIKSKLISAEAFYAAKERDNGDRPATYMLSYFSKRSISVFVVALCLGYLNSGVIITFIGDVMQSFSDAFRN